MVAEKVTNNTATWIKPKLAIERHAKYDIKTIDNDGTVFYNLTVSNYVFHLANGNKSIWHYKVLKGIFKILSPLRSDKELKKFIRALVDNYNYTQNPFNFERVDPSEKYCIEEQSKNYRPSIPKEIKSDVWKKTEGVCIYCGNNLNPFNNFHIEHFHPISKGGKNDIENLFPSCQKCNMRKSDRPLSSLKDKLKIALFWYEKNGLTVPKLPKELV